jgi:pimeloyl-ACP methyl ester carboxylesterase
MENGMPLTLKTNNHAGYSALGLIAVLLALISGCTSPANLDQLAPHSSNPSQIIKAEPFLHRVFEKPGNGNTTRIYIEGDGRPWVTPRSHSSDPTPHRPIAFELMQLDQGHALYLGRPCYFKTADPLCDNARWWTSHRYSETVVTSLVDAVQTLTLKSDDITLVGFSGGGTLAYLMAARLPKVKRLVTIAANLDVELWTQTRGFSTLKGSLDPALTAPLPTAIQQLHLAGSQDQSVPLAVTSGVVARQPNAELRVISDYDHSCCWQEQWPTILGELN